MSDNVIVVAIVVPAMVTLGVVAIVFGRVIFLSAKADGQGAEFMADATTQPSPTSRLPRAGRSKARVAKDR